MFVGSSSGIAAYNNEWSYEPGSLNKLVFKAEQVRALLFLDKEQTEQGIQSNSVAKWLRMREKSNKIESSAIKLI